MSYSPKSNKLNDKMKTSARLKKETKFQKDKLWSSHSHVSRKGSPKRHEEKNDPYPGKAPIPKEKIKQYQRDEPFEAYGMKNYFNRKKYAQNEKKNRDAIALAVRSELLLNEEPGYLECDEEDSTFKITQKNIKDSVDITSATKIFDLNLPQFGPYHMDFTRNGRNLLLGGNKGHVAAIDWVTKKLHCEINVMESIHDVKWLHMPTMFAVAQKNWVHVYDREGVELHCVKKLYRIQKLEFLPYHFLLAAGNDMGFLSWLDISVGQIVSDFNTKSGRLDVLTQNPANAVLITGHPNGVVNMWSPNEKASLVKMLCHTQPVRAVSVDTRGTYLATASVDRNLKIWDLRTYKCLNSYKLGGGAGSLAFSQRGLLAASLGQTVEIYKDIVLGNTEKPYMRHSVPSFVKNIQFCPYEDALGAGHGSGYSSILVPGSGEPNFDALESNPFMNKSQMREMEVKALLEKVQPEMITINPRQLSKVDTKSLKLKIEEKKKILYVKTPQVDFEPYKKPEKGKKLHRKKQKLREQKVQEKVKVITVKTPKKKVQPGALGRFKVLKE